MAAYYRWARLVESDLMRSNDEFTLNPWLHWAKIPVTTIGYHFHKYANVPRRPPGHDLSGFFHFAGKPKLESFKAYYDAIETQKAWLL